MDDKKELLKESFKSAVASTVKSIAAKSDIKIYFDKKNNNEDNVVNLPNIDQLNNVDEYLTVRAIADSEALRIRYTDKKIYKQNEPSGNAEKKLYETAEKIRYEKLGSNYFSGVKKNLDKYFQNKLNKRDKNTAKSLNDEIEEIFELYLRNIIFDKIE